jgi:ASPIC and UnbV/FG-GAP-like repeat/Secretion system C-terminal sorting domain
MKSCLVLALLFFALIPILKINAQTTQFTDVASTLGISQPIQFIRTSANFCDFDGDGYDDLGFSSIQGNPLFIYKNEVTIFEDVTASFQITDSLRSMGLLWADYDNDGDKDLFCGVDFEPAYSRLYRNDNGILVDVTISCGIGNLPTTCNGSAWADYDNDGWLDLFVTNYSEFAPNHLYRNNHDGTFTEVTYQAGVSGFDVSSNYYKLPFGASFFDYDNDGWLDLHVCNDHMTGDFQYHNNGDGTFTDVSESSGAGINGFTMGIAIGDYNGDGFLDMYLSNDPPGNFLLKNNGDGTFTNVAEQLGLTINHTSWGGNFFDYDNDGDLDLFSACETVPNAMFQNNGDGTFTRQYGLGLDIDDKSFGSAIGDLDNNGYYDIAVANEQILPHVYKNAGGSNNWFKLNLKGVLCNRDAIGSRIEAYVNGKMQIFELTCGTSYMSQNSNSTIIGVAQATSIDSIVVIWAGSHTRDVLRNMDVNQTYLLTEGETIVNVQEKSAGVLDFKLDQNYPNPFNPSTKISYNLPVNSRVNLSIYNILGELVTTLVNGNISAGYHRINFNASNLNSGVYLYRLNAEGIGGENFSQSQKMILAK